NDVKGKWRADSVTIDVVRDRDTLRRFARIATKGKLGFYPVPEVEVAVERRSFAEAVLYGCSQPFRMLRLNIKGLASIFTGTIPAGQVGPSGPISIAGIFDDSTAQFFRNAALLMSLVLFYEAMPLPRSGMLRSLPIAGEVLFRRRFSYEMFARIRRSAWILLLIALFSSILQDILKLL
ncbi:MAG: hypothetical protein AAGA85_22105, partial [Bacteroidota bacterium]